MSLITGHLGNNYWFQLIAKAASKGLTGFTADEMQVPSNLHNLILIEGSGKGRNMKKIIILISIYIISHPAFAENFPRPEDVTTLDGLMKAYYEVVSAKKGELRQKERDLSLHQPHSPVTMIVSDKDGNIVTRNLTIDDFHANSDKPMETGFIEYEIHRTVQRFGATAHVWSTYAIKESISGPVIQRGINSIQLYNDGQRWWIVAEMWDSRDNVPDIPAEYLPSSAK